MAFLNWLESTDYAQWILVSSVGWPLMLSLHAFGTATILGIVFALNLRMLGLYRTLPYTALHGLMGIAWIGIAINVYTGLSIFMSQASSYVTSVPFLTKIGFIVFGIINLVYVRKTLRIEAANWEAAGNAPPKARWLALSSLGFWVLALVTGRLIAYL
jgi:ABC-type nickel/cobalt efflux system permease component RcnA